MRIPNRKDDFAGCVGAAAQSAANALRYGNHSQLAEVLERGKALALSRRDAAPMLAAMLEQACLGIDAARLPLITEDYAGPNAALGDVTERPVERVLRVSEVKFRLSSTWRENSWSPKIP